MINCDKLDCASFRCVVSLLLETVDIYGFLYEYMYVKHTERCCWLELTCFKSTGQIFLHHSMFTEVLLSVIVMMKCHVKKKNNQLKKKVFQIIPGTQRTFRTSNIYQD